MQLNKNDSLLADIDLVIFDMDGTIYQLDGDNNTIKNSTLYKKVIKNSIEFVKRQEDIGEEEASIVINEALENEVGISAFLAERYGITRTDYFDVVWNINPEGVVKEYEVSTNVIKSLSARKILLTSAPGAWQRRVFSFLGFTQDDFEAIYTGEMFGSKNEIFELLADENVASRIISVGDQENTDISPAELKGMKTFLVNHPNDLEKLLV